MPTINKNRIKQQQTPYNHNNESAKYYNTKQWINLRKYYIKHNPLCEVCLSNGKVKPAEHVHHITPFLKGLTHQRRMELLLDEDNLMSVCKDCHYEIHYGKHK